MIADTVSTCFLDVGCLRAFGALHNLKLHCVSLLKSAVAIASDSRIMNENIRAIIAPDEAVSFAVVKPFYSSMHFAFPPEQGLRDFIPQRPVNNPNAVKDTNGAECTRIDWRVNSTIDFPC